MAEHAIRVLAAGMVGSGSTFLYNVLREILGSDTNAPVFATYSDEWSPFLLAHKRLVLKSHWGTESLAPEAARGTLLPVVSVRHPGDCVCSDMERFGFGFEFAVRRVALSLRFCSALRQSGKATLFRYEDGFTSDLHTAASLAELMGIALPAERVAEIVRKYDAAGTRAYAESLERAAGLVTSPDNPHDAWCPTTQIHKGHIGKQTSGRWRDLTSDQRRIIDELCGEEAAAFGYAF